MPLYVYIFILIVLRLESLANSENVEATLKPYSPGKIINGNITTIEEHPYQAYITIGSNICSGSIISETVVLTAAHCLHNSHAPDVFVYFGVTKPRFLTTAHECNKLAVHPDFSTGTMDFDIGLIWVDKIYIDNIKTKIIDIAPSSFTVKTGSKLMIAGYGIIKCHPGIECSHGVRAADLQHVEVPVIDWNICKDVYASHHRLIAKITSRMLCAGYLERDKPVRDNLQDACFGDSGAGAVQDNMIVGVVSFAYECGRSDSPGIFADVRKIDWIGEQLRIPYHFIKVSKIDPIEMLTTMMIDVFGTIFTIIIVYFSI